MRINRLLALAAIVSLIIVPSSLLASPGTSESGVSIAVKAAPSKVCHPKKPITCRAADLSTIADGTAVSLSTAPQVEKQAAVNSAICMGPRWHCKSADLSTIADLTAITLSAAPQVEKQAAVNSAICMGPRWHCKAADLSTIADLTAVSRPAAPQVEKQAAVNSAICMGPRWHCSAQTLG